MLTTFKLFEKLRTFELTNLPQIGDYILFPKFPDSYFEHPQNAQYKDYINFLSNHIGTISTITTGGNCYEVGILYENINYDEIEDVQTFFTTLETDITKGTKWFTSINLTQFDDNNLLPYICTDLKDLEEHNLTANKFGI